MNLQEYFQQLHDTKAPYVVLSGYTDLPFQAKRLVLLTSNEKLLVRVGQLHKIAGQMYQFTDEKPTEIYIIPKGRGFFPDRFETELLTNRDCHNEIVHIPESTLRAYAHLYWMLVRDNCWADMPERRLPIKDLVLNRTGPAMPCDLGDIPCFPA